MAGPMLVKMIDEATPFLTRVGRESPQYIRKAIKSSGWWMRENIKAGIKEGAPGGTPYREFTGITNERGKTYSITTSRISQKTGKFKQIRRRYTQNQLYREKGRHRSLGRLAQAVRYKYYSDNVRVVIGWISRSAQRLGTIQEQGQDYPVTRKMRGLFAFSDIPMPNKSFIRIPARPTIGPEFRQHSPQVPGYVEGKVVHYIEKAEQQTKAEVK